MFLQFQRRYISVNISYKLIFNATLCEFGKKTQLKRFGFGNELTKIKFYKYYMNKNE